MKGSGDRAERQGWEERGADGEWPGVHRITLLAERPLAARYMYCFGMMNDVVHTSLPEDTHTHTANETRDGSEQRRGDKSVRAKRQCEQITRRPIVRDPLT